MFRKRLEELGIAVPLLPTTSVGSLPEHPDLAVARKSFSTGDMTRQDFDGRVRAAIEFWIKKQEEIGVDILVDGEQYREEPIGYFASGFRGFMPGGLVRVARNFYRRKPIITGKIRWPGPITVGWWKYAQSLTAKPVKATLLGPYSLVDGSLNRHYPDRRTATLALAREIHREAEALAGAGCRIIQIDEPTLAARPEEMSWAAEAMKMVTGRLPVYFIMHACYTDFAGILPALQEFPVHNLDLSLADADSEQLRLTGQSGIDKDISVGVVDVQAAKPDSPETIRGRIRRAMNVFAAGSLWVDPDCGLKGLPVEEAISRLKAMREAAVQARRDV